MISHARPSPRVRRLSIPAWFSVLLLTMATATLAGCGDDPASPPSGQGVVIPKSGSSFTFQAVSRDETGRVVQSDERTTMIEADRLAIAGRTGVVRALTKNVTQYLHYSPNGDFSVMFIRNLGRPNVDSTWMLFPFGSKGRSTFAPDTGSGQGIQLVFSGRASYSRDDQISVAGETFDTKVAIVEQNVVMMVEGEVMQSDDRIDTVYFAPRLGYYVRQVGSQRTAFGGSDTTTFYNTGSLSRYTLK